MSTRINEREFVLLAYLRDHVKAFGDLYKLPAAEVARGLGIDLDALEKDASFLSEHGLAGIHILDTSSDGEESHWFMGIYLTGAGEDLMRTLEEELAPHLAGAPQNAKAKGVTKRITTEGARFLYDTAKGVVVKLVADFVSGRSGP